MRKMMQRSLSCLLTLAMVVTMLMTSTLAAEKGAKLTFEFPKEHYHTTDGITLDVYKGTPTFNWSAYTKDMVSELPVVGKDVAASGLTVSEPGIYVLLASGKGYYDCLQNIYVTEADIANSVEKKIEVIGGNMGGNGYEPGAIVGREPEGYTVNAYDTYLLAFNEEIMKAFEVEDQGYKTPYFTKDKSSTMHEATTQEEMMTFLNDRDKASKEMHLYSIGTTPNYKFSIPLVLFTKTSIPENATLEEAAKLVNDNGKINIWYSAQIHSDEPSAGEGALVVIDNLVNDSKLLDKANIIIVPRINPEGSYLFIRENYNGYDMNRDYMSVKAYEIDRVHSAANLFMPEVAIDGHEFSFYDGVEEDGATPNADDLETTPATSLNISPEVTKIALEMCGEAFDEARALGLRPNHYGTTVTNPIGRAYWGLMNSLSFLVETRGMFTGLYTMERRVLSQEVAAMTYITYSAEHADEIMKAVADARADVIAKGKTYSEDNILALYQTKSGKTNAPYVGDLVKIAADGSIKSSEKQPLPLNDTITRSRTRPTAYVIPADHANIAKILYVMDNHGVEYYKLNAGSTASLQQYYYVGDYMVDGKAKGIEADLRDAADVTFANGAYVFPMDQVAGNVIAMLCEPDVTDSNGYDGTLYQYKQIDYDKTTKNFPLYRYTGNDPRTTLVSSGTSAEPTQPTQPEKPSQPASSDTYTVVSGDSLWKIASKQLGNGNRWTEIYDLNKDTVKSPSVIFVGQILKMPLTAVSQ